MVVVTVLGLGRLGGNIAGDLAFNGHTVRAWDNDKNALDKLHERLAYEKKRLKEDKLLVHPQFLVNYEFRKKLREITFFILCYREMCFVSPILMKHCLKLTLLLKLSMRNLRIRDNFWKVSVCFDFKFIFSITSIFFLRSLQTV